MLNGGIRSPTVEDVDPVHNLIEQCLQLYLSKRDAVNLIFKEANIDPSFTELVWEQLEQDNPEFFKFYYIRLALKQQIELFNGLLRDQARLAQQIANGGASSPGSNGSHVSGNGSHMPGNGSHISGNGSGLLGNGYQSYHTSSNGSHGQENGYHRPENGSRSQENGHDRPENGSHNREYGSNTPCNGAYNPINRSHWPVNGTHGPINESHGPVHGSHRSETGSHGPVNGARGPVNGSQRPENGGRRPVNGPHVPVNGAHRQQLEHIQQNDHCYLTNEARNSQAGISSNISCPFSSMSMLQTPAPSNVPTSARGINLQDNYQNANSNTGLTHGLNEGIIRSGSDYSNSQEAVFNPNGNVVGTHGTLEEGSHFSYVEASSHVLDESLLAVNDSSFGPFGQIPGDFNFSALPTTYPGVLENYVNSAFDATNPGIFFVSQDRNDLTEDISGGISNSYKSYNEDLKSH